MPALSDLKLVENLVKWLRSNLQNLMPPLFEYDIRSSKEVAISSHGAAEIVFKKEGKYWVAEGSDNKLKYGTMEAAAKMQF